MNNIYVLNKNYSKIGTLSNEGANPQAPYFNDLYVQELETGADTYEFSTMSSKYTQDLLEIGNHIMFAYRNRNELFTITSIQYSHSEGYKTIGVYAEGIGFELLEVFMERPKDTGSSGGNDSDNDGDDNTDDEYADPDDVYIDENGNIIYDKNGGTDYADPNDVTIDGDGNIIYRRSKKKKNDSLEFKNISYPRFLSILLKGTGWSYVCQPGLEDVKHDITVRYDRNIYAVLQDSMQDYRGIELEFVHEYNNGSVQKVIKAYKDGGRGSFIGKRFEYGVNVRGITKMQEVANSEDDTVLRIDNVGIDITYDVDFALKSTEVPEIEIGDTHYVIDKDFYPPMTIKARIGKIEISFSDPTRNKIYLANNKRIRGSAIEEELDIDDIKDLLDEPETPEDPEEDPEDPTTPLVPVAGSNDLIKAPRMHSYEFLLYTNMEDPTGFEASNRVSDAACVDLAPEAFNTFSNKEIYDYLVYGIDVWDVSYSALDQLRYNKTGAAFPSNKCFRLVPNDGNKVNFNPICMNESGLGPSGNKNDKDYMRECVPYNEVSTRIFSDIMGAEDRPDFDIPGNDPISKCHLDKHMLDIGSLASGLVSALQYHVKKVHGNTSADPGTGGGGSNAGGDIGDEYTDVRGDNGVFNSITAYQQLTVEGVTWTDTLSVRVNSTIAKLVAHELLARDKLTLPDGTVITKSGWSKVPCDHNVGNNAGESGNTVSIAYLDGRLLEYATTEYVDSKLGSGGSSSGGSTTSGCIFEKVSDNFYYTDNDVQIERDLYVNGTLHINSGDGMGMGIVDCDILKVVEIQFANGTTLPTNSIATVSDLSEYATVEQLQEEIRAKDEQIATLEDRLAKIEALLGINNNDN